MKEKIRVRANSKRKIQVPFPPHPLTFSGTKTTKVPPATLVTHAYVGRR